MRTQVCMPTVLLTCSFFCWVFAAVAVLDGGTCAGCSGGGGSDDKNLATMYASFAGSASNLLRAISACFSCVSPWSSTCAACGCWLAVAPAGFSSVRSSWTGFNFSCQCSLECGDRLLQFSLSCATFHPIPSFGSKWCPPKYYLTTSVPTLPKPF